MCEKIKVIAMWSLVPTLTVIAYMLGSPDYLSGMGALIAIPILYSQLQKTGSIHKTDILIRLNERFNSNDFRNLRSKCCQRLLKNKVHPDDKIDDVLNFFEELGELLKVEALDKKSTWAIFYYWVVHYYHATKEYRLSFREDDPALFTGFQYLFDELNNQEKSNRNKNRYQTAPKYDSMASLEAFLIKESQMEIFTGQGVHGI